MVLQSATLNGDRRIVVRLATHAGQWRREMRVDRKPAAVARLQEDGRASGDRYDRSVRLGMAKVTHRRHAQSLLIAKPTRSVQTERELAEGGPGRPPLILLLV